MPPTLKNTPGRAGPTGTPCRPRMDVPDHRHGPQQRPASSPPPPPMPAVLSKLLYVVRVDYGYNAVLELARTVRPISACTDVAFGDDGPKGDFHAWLVWNGQIIDPSPLPESECPPDADATRRVYIPWQDPAVDEWLRRHADRLDACRTHVHPALVTRTGWCARSGFCYWNCRAAQSMYPGSAIVVGTLAYKARAGSAWRGTAIQMFG